ncbi:MAG: hypothetical protein L3K17_05485, partial [Thermoplasmata archaeon]|nr:hypothetical protein [Thermoplasmata archaeon]
MNALEGSSRRNRATLAGVVALTILLATQLFAGAMHPVDGIIAERVAGPPVMLGTPAVRAFANSPGSPPVAIGATVASTLNLLNGTFTPGAVRTLSAFAPTGIVYAPPSNQVFVSEVSTQTLTVLNATTWAIIGSIPVGAYPTAGVFDPSNGMIYVANYESSNLSVVDPLTDKVVASISTPAQGYAVAYDSTNGYLYVANGGGDDVVVINPVSETTVTSITVGDYVSGVAFDSTNGDVYATTDVTQVVAVINGATNALIKSLPIGVNSLSVCFDSLNGYIYAGNAGSSNLTVVDGATNLEAGSISTFGPGPMLVDPTNGELYVVGDDELVSAIVTANGTTVATMPVGSFPTGITLDTLTGDLFVADRYTNNVSILDPTTQKTIGSVLMGVSPSGMVADPAAGLVALLDTDLSELFLVDRDHRLAATLALTQGPSAITYDPADGLVYVVDTNPSAIEAFNLTTRALVHDFVEPSLAAGDSVAFDPGADRLLVASGGTDQLTAVDPVNGTLLGSVTVGS